MKYDLRERVIDKLNELAVHINRMNSIKVKDPVTYEKADVTVKYATERNLQLVSDIELDVLVLLYKKFGTEVAGSPSSMFASLKPMLGNKLVESFNKRRDLRNKLVHVYKEFSFDKEVFEQSKNMGDVDEFIKEIKKSIAKHDTD